MRRELGGAFFFHRLYVKLVLFGGLMVVCSRCGERAPEGVRHAQCAGCGRVDLPDAAQRASELVAVRRGGEGGGLDQGRTMKEIKKELYLSNNGPNFI